MRYFYDRPPEDTLIAWQKENNIKPDMNLLVSGSYTVTRGDNLSEIAQRFGVSTQELRAHNKLKNDVIRIGQKLSIPGLAVASANVLPIEHKIVRGETLSGIAQRYRISTSSLRTENNLRNDVIMVGQVLKIPAP